VTVKDNTEMLEWKHLMYDDEEVELLLPNIVKAVESHKMDG